MISIKNPKLIREMEDDFIRNLKMSVQEKFDMVDDMYEFAYKYGKLSEKDVMGNLESLVKTVKVFRDTSKNT